MKSGGQKNKEIVNEIIKKNKVMCTFSIKKDFDFKIFNIKYS